MACVPQRWQRLIEPGGGWEVEHGDRHRARSYQEMVDALAEGLPPAGHPGRAHPSGLAAARAAPTFRAGKPPWTILELAAHFDVFMGLTMGLVWPTSAQPVVDRASFYISVSDRSTVSPVIYQYIVDHAEATPRPPSATRSPRPSRPGPGDPDHAPDTIGPGFFGPMRLDEFVATRWWRPRSMAWT